MEIIEKAEEHFRPVLKQIFGKPAFILVENSPDIVSGARTTVIFFLSRFLERFGDLVENDDYHIANYIQRSEELDMRIPDFRAIFESWKEKGCLHE